jgi:molecular chaperone DnaK
MRIVGIDLGTTNSVAAINGTVLQHASGTETSTVLPSVVAFPPSGAVLVGATAKKRRAIDPKHTLYSAKRLIGQRWLSAATSRFRKNYPFDLIETSIGGVALRTRGGDLTPIDVGTRVVSKLFVGQQSLMASVAAVVTVPASFSQEARQATLRAVEHAGITRVHALEEPVATAVAYTTTTVTRDTRALVYDLGGGTFDLALIEHTAGGARILKHAGDPYLGGDDIDRAIGEWVSLEVLKAHGWDLRSDAEVYERLLVQVERAKIRLGYATAARIEMSQVDPAAPAAAEGVTLTREKASELAMPFIQRTFAIADEVLRDSGLKASQIDAVYLGGGATLMSAVRDGIAGYFGKLPRCDFDPMEVVAIGASLHQPDTK